MSSKSTYEWLKEKIGEENLNKKIDIKAISSNAQEYIYYITSNNIQNGTFRHWLV